MRNKALDRIDGNLQRLLGRDAALDPLGNVSLEFRGGIRLHIEVPEDHETAFAHAEVTQIADDATIRSAMELNQFRLAPPGAWLAYDADDGVIRLCATLDAETPDELDRALAGLVAGVEAARLRLAGAPSPAEDAAEALQPPVEQEFLLRL